ncbi:MAG: TolC family protein [Pedobacter sp.]|nr:TolC family protein [Chitinophagaceae bacterium]
MQLKLLHVYLKKALVTIIVGSICFVNTHAQTSQFQKDSLNISLDSAENMFLRQNLLLLAQKFNIDAQKALIIQAKLFPNPNFSISRGPFIPIHDDQSNYPESNFFKNSESAASISQLILLAGKRIKQIGIAVANAKLAEYQFYDLVRTLKYTLRTDFFSIYYLQQSAKVYDKEITALQQVVTAFNQQNGKGYISEKEVIRVKALLYSLQSEYNDLINQINDTQSELRLVLQVKNVYLVPTINDAKLTILTPSQFALSTLIDTAFKNRTDLLIARTTADISKLNYSYQKALAVPDITASISYDRQGSYARNFNAAGITMDLPFFNRNQGNIKSAKFIIDINTTTQKSTEATIEEQINRALQKAFDADMLYKKIDPTFSKDFERLTNEVVINYQKRNISILDFLDFYDSYKQNILQINSIKANRVNAFEDLNFYTGTNFFN